MPPITDVEFLTKQEKWWFMEREEELDRDGQYVGWPIASLVANCKAVAGLNYSSSRFISHGCREVVFEIPFERGSDRQARQAAQRVKVRNTLHDQDFVSIRRLQSLSSKLFNEVSRFSWTSFAERQTDGRLSESRWESSDAYPTQS